MYCISKNLPSWVKVVIAEILVTDPLIFTYTIVRTGKYAKEGIYVDELRDVTNDVLSDFLVKNVLNVDVYPAKKIPWQHNMVISLTVENLHAFILNVRSTDSGHNVIVFWLEGSEIGQTFKYIDFDANKLNVKRILKPAKMNINLYLGVLNKVKNMKFGWKINDHVFFKDGRQGKVMKFINKQEYFIIKIRMFNGDLKLIRANDPQIKKKKFPKVAPPKVTPKVATPKVTPKVAPQGYP